MSDLRPLDGEPLLAILEKAGVDFVVIGGFAVSAHGHLRAPELEYAELEAAAVEDAVFGHRVRFLRV